MHVMVRSAFSDDVKVALAPFRTYRALAAGPPPTIGRALMGPIAWLACVACFVSWTTSAGLLLDHLVFAPLVWCFAPAVQGGWSVLVTRGFGEPSSARALSLYYVGHGPWLVLLFLIGGACLFLPDPFSFFRTAPLVVAGAAAVASLWCGVLTFAMYRAALGLSRRRSAVATAAHYLGCTALFVGWFLVTGQLLPLWGIM